MEWWQKAVVVPVKRAWIAAAARLTTRHKKEGNIIVAAAVCTIIRPLIPRSLTHSFIHQNTSIQIIKASSFSSSSCSCVCETVNVVVSPTACLAVYIYTACLDWFILIDFFCLHGEQSVISP